MVSQSRRLLFLLVVMLVLVVSGCANTDSSQPSSPVLDGTGRIVIRNASLVLTMDPKLGERDGRVIGDQARVIADAQAASDRIQKLLERELPLAATEGASC